MSFSPTAALPGSIKRWRLAIFLFSGVVGVSMASWIVRIPAVRDTINVSIAEMGLVLFGLSVGSMAGILGSAALVRARGGRQTIALGGVLAMAGMFTLALGVGSAQAVVVALGLALIGGGTGVAEIALNIEGAELERLTGRSVLPALHGSYSGGTVVGSLLGILLTWLQFPVAWHLAVVGIAGVGVMAWIVSVIPSGTGRESGAAREAGAARESRLAIWRDRRVIALGLIVLALALAEGSANDWLPLLMVDEHHVSEVAGTVVYTLFAVAMTIGRFSGAALLNRFGAATVLRGSALVSAAGIALVIFSPNALIAGAAVLLWGLGAALGFPVTISAAGQSRNAVAAVAAVATAGYLAFLAGPPILGFIGEHVGLRGAMVLVLVLVAAVALLAGAARSPREDPEGEHPAG